MVLKLGFYLLEGPSVSFLDFVCYSGYKYVAIVVSTLVCMYMCLYIQVCACVCTYRCVRVWICSYLYSHGVIFWTLFATVFTNMSPLSSAPWYVCTCDYIYRCAYVNIYIFIYTWCHFWDFVCCCGYKRELFVISTLVYMYICRKYTYGQMYIFLTITYLRIYVHIHIDMGICVYICSGHRYFTIFISTCVCIYVCLWTYICVCVCLWTYICVCVCMCVYVCADEYM